MARTLNIAILECDSAIQKIAEIYGQYGDICAKLLAQSLKALDLSSPIQFKFTSWDVVNKELYPELQAIDAILIPGSKHSAFENEAWIVRLVDFVRQAFDSRVPIIGICFGHQILSRALGAEVGKNSKGYEISVDVIQLSKRGKELFGQDQLSLHQMHRDIVYTTPKGVENLGHSQHCEVQGLYQQGRVFSVQAHPEFDEFITSEIVHRRHDQGIFDDSLFQDGLSRASLKHDGGIVAGAMVQFLLGV